MIEMMANLLGIVMPDANISNILNHYLQKSECAIKSYCNVGIIPEEYNPIVIELAVFYYKNRDREGIVQQSQGSRSITIEKGIPETIRLALPLPRVRVIG